MDYYHYCVLMITVLFLILFQRNLLPLVGSTMIWAHAIYIYSSCVCCFYGYSGYLDPRLSLSLSLYSKNEGRKIMGIYIVHCGWSKLIHFFNQSFLLILHLFLVRTDSVHFSLTCYSFRRCSRFIILYYFHTLFLYNNNILCLYVDSTSF